MDTCEHEVPCKRALREPWCRPCLLDLVTQQNDLNERLNADVERLTEECVVLRRSWRVDTATAHECGTCGEIEGVEGECLSSQRVCGHHCNCIWIHDACCWCPAHVNDEGVLVQDHHPARGADGVCGHCGAGPTEHHRDGCWTVLDTMY